MMDLPIQGTITSGYGNRSDPKTGKTKFHYGVDIGASRGTPLLSNVTGVILDAGWRGSYGNMVKVQTGDTIQIFGHLDSIDVKTGQMVNTGTKLGEIGSTGYSTGNHLHWQVLQGGENVNPLTASIGAVDKVKDFFSGIFSLPNFLGGGNVLTGEIDIKDEVNKVIVNVVLLVALFLFVALALFPGTSQRAIKEVVKK